MAGWTGKRFKGVVVRDRRDLELGLERFVRQYGGPPRLVLISERCPDPAMVREVVGQDVTVEVDRCQLGSDVFFEVDPHPSSPFDPAKTRRA